MDTPPTISLVDNTDVVHHSVGEESLSQIPTATGSQSISRRFNKVSVRGELKRRKYAKWQPDRLGLSDADDSPSRRLSQARNQLNHVDTNTNTMSGASFRSSPSQPSIAHHAVDATDFASASESINVAQQTSTDPLQQQHHESDRRKGKTPVSELDILYENQRGWFFFGIPLYSHSSLLNFDPSAWVTHDFHESPVNITNAQLPDPSWIWAWRCWYVDMSGDVDDQGWQYSLYFGSSAWHGSHPWFHSFVRRRRWVRLRVKRAVEETSRGRSGFEKAHMLNADYFTIHSARERSKAVSPVSASRWQSGPTDRATTATTTTTVEEEPLPLEEICNIPTLMYVLKAAIVDREKTDTLKRFIEDGGEELHYLDDKIPEIMSMFVFQNSRWQFLEYLVSVINELSEKAATTSGAEAEELQRKQNNLTKAAETVRRYITGPELLGHENRESLDLTPASQDHLLENAMNRPSFQPISNGGQIKGIPEAAEIGLEGHIFRPS